MAFLQLPLVLGLFLYSAFYFSLAIPSGGDNGVLYRFSPTSSNETDELLAWAEVRYRLSRATFSIHSE
jgi:hypothetical protein